MPGKITRRIATVELADGKVLDVRITNPDRIRYEETANRSGWPSMVINNRDETATMPVLDYSDTFQAWAALKRTGQYAGTWDDFKQTDCVAVVVEEETVDPTRPGLGSGTSPSSRGSAGVPSPSSPPQTTSS